MELLHSFQAFIRENVLLGPGARVLVAVSGGVDSLVLARLFREGGVEIGLAHCNFQLRGAESDGDEAFVRELAAGWKAPLFVRHFDTKKVAAEKNLSVQVAARELRYAWFEDVRSEHGYAVVATGHNLNDSVETALLHFIRGTGLTGLGGIPVRNGAVIRPLLFATRDEILTYARSNQLAWREDSSNASDQYTRNVIRKDILPRLQAINPSFLTSAARMLHHLQETDRNLQYLLRTYLGQPDAAGVYRLDKERLAQLPDLSGALFELLQSFGFLPEQVRQLSDAWSQTGAEWFSASGWRLLNDRSVLVLLHSEQQEHAVMIDPDDLLVRLPDGSRLAFTPASAGAPLPEGQTAVVIDAEKLRFPLLLRRWKPGDIFQPLGMDGRHQKLQDFFTNLKLSRLEKENTWILENNDQTVIWVLGKRLDERYKVRTETCKLLKISWLKES